MHNSPASATSHPARHTAQVIGLLLARLFAYVVRNETSGEKAAPADIIYLVSSANAMVHTLIRSLAAESLKTYGHSHAARALRDWHNTHARAAITTPEEPVSPEALRRQLEASIALFERAEVLAHQLACMIICALGLAFQNERSGRYSLSVRTERISHTPRLHGPAPEPWPPPDSNSHLLSWIPVFVFHETGTAVDRNKPSLKTAVPEAKPSGIQKKFSTLLFSAIVNFRRPHITSGAARSLVLAPTQISQSSAIRAKRRRRCADQASLL